jgi:hypothetical protein
MSASDPLEKWRDMPNWQRKLANKHNAIEFARMHGCRTPEVYWRGRDLRGLDFDRLPRHFVMKPTKGHSCRHVYLMAEGVNLMDRQAYSHRDLIDAWDKVFNDGPNVECLVQEFVRSEAGEHCIPTDYKLYMFNGELAYIRVIERHAAKDAVGTLYDRAWNPVSMRNMYYGEAGYQAPPRCLDDIIAGARRLSRTYEIFCRIDFFASDRGAVFCEFTPTPHATLMLEPALDSSLVEYWDRFCPGMI